LLTGNEKDMNRTMHAKHWTLLGILTVSLILAGCGGSSGSGKETAADPFLFERLPTGAGWDHAKAVLPGLGRPQPLGGFESLGREGLTEAILPVTIDGHTGERACNFRNGRLYSSFVRVADIHERRAAAIADSIEGMFATRYGPGTADRQDEPGAHAVTRYWDADSLTVSVSHGGVGDRWFISWGYQDADARD
jgi:hypothetical protein